jgi:hypothetical protein
MALAKAQLWFVCGYSLQAYDRAIRDLLMKAAPQTFGLIVIIADPYSKDLEERWRTITPAGTEIIALPGLPDLLEEPKWLNRDQGDRSSRK